MSSLYARLFTRVALIAAAVVAGCSATPWNNPYPATESGANILYSSFSERPKHLDPVQSYSTNEISFTAQIYEPPLQYHYLQRPYTLIPAVAEAVPVPRYYDAKGNELTGALAAARAVTTIYEVKLKPGVMYQPHPAFARTNDGAYVYHGDKAEPVGDRRVLADFTHTGTRELDARDFAYQIKRLAHPRLHSPIFGLMSDYIEGLREYAETLRKENERLIAAGQPDAWLDLDRFPLKGIEVVNAHTFRIRLKGAYPQFIYWLAMPFFAPVPREVDRFYGQLDMIRRNITLDWYPVGTGPYMLTQNNPNRIMVLERNPNFRGENYPAEGAPGDAEAGLLLDAGKPLPFIDKAVFTLEKEGIPRWNKFLQGYYDASGIGSDTFDQAVKLGSGGDAVLTDEMKEQGIRLSTSVAPSTYYMGFNMLDPVVGGTSERARKLRQAISIAVDYEEFVSIFQNGRGIPGHGPIAPGIYGYRDGEAGINRVVYDWVDGQARRKPIEAAKKLLAEAGYPDGVDAKSGAPLVLYFDVTARGAEAKSTLEWFKTQFAKINIQLEIRPTDYNRFQDKIRKGNAQIFEWGWHADYPDPENFLFLLYGPQSKVKVQGENAANYANAEFDRLFDEVKSMPNSPERQTKIDRMVDILRRDAPWLWGYHPKDYSLYHGWLGNLKSNKIAYNTLKYQKVDAVTREARRREWNQPIAWPLAAGLLALFLFAMPAVLTWRRHEQRAGRGG